MSAFESSFPGSPFAPLQHAEFRRLWAAALCLHLCLWIEIVTAGWMMVSLSGSPLMIGLVQSAATLPTFVLALHAGALADLVDRRRLLLVGQILLVLAAVSATLLTATGLLSPALLLLVTLAFGIVQAMLSPSWFISQMDVLPSELRLAGMALSSASYSSARAVGPALAGGVIAAAGAAATLGVTTAIAVLSVVLLKSAPLTAVRPQGAGLRGVSGAVADALRFVAADCHLQRELLGTAFFVVSASGLWALLPLVAGHGAGGYGLLLGCIGGGTVIGSLALQLAHHHGSTRGVELAGGSAFALGTLCAASSDSTWLVCTCLGLAGVGWAWVGNIRITLVQQSAPMALRARTLAWYLLTFQGGMALGGLVWGGLGGLIGIGPSLVLSTVAQLGAAATGWYWRSRQDATL